MADDGSRSLDDETIVLQLMDGDPDALPLLLRTHAPRVRALLCRQFRGVLLDPEIDEAMNQAAFNLYSAREQFDPKKGTLRAWLYRMALNAARGILRDEKRHFHEDLTPDYPSNDVAHNIESPDNTMSTQSPLVVALLDGIETVLSPTERAIIKADLAAGHDAVADAGRLAAMLGCSKNQIYVLRHRARDKLHQLMTHQGQMKNTQRGRP
jgi:RNA polymerase sigma factor (sigma-70 family)